MPRPRSAIVASLLAGALAYLVLEPWHGATVLSLSEQHGLDAADLPVLVLVAVALAVARSGGGEPRQGGRAATAIGVALGVLLLAGLLSPRIGSALVPAGGGTFGRSTGHTDGVRAVPVGRWTHLAATYDGSRYTLYVDGDEASSTSASGRIRATTDPLWIGGNHPYGEYFRGVVDEARVYDRALSPSEIRTAMRTPLAGPEPGLEAAYAFDGGRAADMSGHGNTGTSLGARWTREGRYGGGMRFDGDGELVRVPGSRSLDLTDAMTVMAWVKPTERQEGWRTVLHRQTDAYFLTASGGLATARTLARVDDVRLALTLLLLVLTGILIARGRAPWATQGRRWYWPVALLVAGSLADVAFAPTDTLIAPALVAAWLAATASGRAERAIMAALAAVFAIATVMVIADDSAPLLPTDSPGVARAAAFGLLLVAAALLRARQVRAVGG